jgi:serine/threonine-protein kinase
MKDDDRLSDTSKHWASAPDEPTPKRADDESAAAGQQIEFVEAPKPGDRIANRYTLERLIGSGGVGDVFLALDDVHGRYVALKLLRGQLARNIVVVNRFRREARITAQLSSPHAVKVHDFDQAADGLLYLAMEYLEGEAMNDLLEREGFLPQRRVMDIAMDLLHVLGEAHGFGIIHQDIKPANVFLAKGLSSAEPIVKLLDFGIAKLRDVEGFDSSRNSDVWGTPRYMSLEQARGRKVDQRSDLYSLGVLMYKALTGTFPHEASNAAEVALALLNEVTESPDKRRPELGISPELGNVVLKALAKQPDARYASALEMSADLVSISASREG